MFDKFEAYLKGAVLDVGCYQAYLKTLLPDDTQYTGIDIAGTPDIQMNLEEIERLPFEDNQFDCVVCADVLEHLDNLHAIFAELLRQSHQLSPNTKLELLIPDFMGNRESCQIVFNEKPDILNHNLETVPRLYRDVRPSAVFGRSLNVLSWAKEAG
ncbi:MAG: methyltransferase domain-containing protein, partial [Planctomycetes bacterium]|nr:methyltransferase domain-containing protein [Planctomycetota bacterium]